MTESLLITEPRLSLGHFPTPLERLTRLEQHLNGPTLYIKRDDLSGLAMGGNKVRKLEFLLGEAQQQGCDCLITAGAAQSNHCRQTAAAAARLGMPCHLMLGGAAPARSQGNTLLDQLLGANLHWCGEHRKGEDIPALKASLVQQGFKPYVVPYGGSSRTGTLGFMQALLEVQQQIETTAFSHIVIASSSGATQAGLCLAQQLWQLPTQILGIHIDKEEVLNDQLQHTIVRLAEAQIEYFKLSLQFDSTQVHLLDGYTGAGYGVVGEPEREAINLMAKLEGILLDPVYTGRAMAGLLDLIRNGRFNADDRVLFWHTGGTPALFAYADELSPA